MLCARCSANGILVVVAIRLDRPYQSHWLQTVDVNNKENATHI